ncbi:Splicing factor 3B subunit, partial [Daphnia magna]
AVAIGGRQTFTAPAAILNDVAGEDFDPFAEHRISTIADREDEYRAMRWKLIISPERVDSFAEVEHIIQFNLILK